MTVRGRKRMFSILAVLAGLALAGWLGLQYAIARNGPAVVDVVDRVTGSERRVAMVERAAYGADPRQSVAVYRESGRAGRAKSIILLFNTGAAVKYNHLLTADGITRLDHKAADVLDLVRG